MYRKILALLKLHTVSQNMKEVFCDDHAQKLNTLLYKDASGIDRNALNNIEEEIKRACVSLGYSDEYTKNWLTHNYRLYFSLEEIKRIVVKYQVKNIVDMGEESLFAHILQNSIPHIHITSTRGDLRKNFGIDDMQVDMIVSTEVLEHISDLPTGYGDTFTMSGLQETLKLCHKHLKKNGVLFITTPNAGSVMIIEKILRGDMPMLYDPHIREYTMESLRKELLKAGFKIVNIRAVHCISIENRLNFSHIFQVLLDGSYEHSNRGDDLFILARKA